MKLIKEGRKQKGWAKEYVCSGSGNKGGGCGATLLVEEGDLFQTYRSNMGWYVTFECSQCSVQTDITDSKFIARDLQTYKIWKTNYMCHGICNTCNNHNCDSSVCTIDKCNCENDSK